MKTQSSRPLSPHLQIYRLPMTAVMSISHRITGAILSGGTLLIAAWLLAAAAGPDYYNQVMGVIKSPFGAFILFAWSFVLYYHLCNGVRHLFWDTGRFFSLKAAKTANWIVILAACALTAATWCCAGKM